MTRRIKRHRSFDLTLEIKDDQFVRPPRESQRNWLLSSVVNEMTDNLTALDRAAARFVPGAPVTSAQDREQALLSDQEIMEDWQIPLMRAMADAVTASHGSVLEIGFGRGIGSSLIQERGVQKHTIIECNDSIVERYMDWRKQYADREITLAHGLWQDVLEGLGEFDGIFFHTYPLNETDAIEQLGESITFAEHFFAHAARHLKPGGVFTYLSFEIDSMSRPHQRALFEHFSSINLHVVPLTLPEDVHDAWWSDAMVAVSAFR